MHPDRILHLLGIGDAQVIQDTAAELKLHSGSLNCGHLPNDCWKSDISALGANFIVPSQRKRWEKKQHLLNSHNGKKKKPSNAIPLDPFLWCIITHAHVFRSHRHNAEIKWLQCMTHFAEAGFYFRNAGAWASASVHRECIAGFLAPGRCSTTGVHILKRKREVGFG